MQYVWATLLMLLNLGFVGLSLVGLPGIWMMILVAGVVCWMQSGPTTPDAVVLFGWRSLGAAVVIAVLAEVAEFFAGVYGSAKAGGSKHGAIGAFVGSIVGGVAGTFVIPVPIVGSIIGACAGALLGALFLELGIGRSGNEALASGVGAGIGRLAGTLIKLAAGLVVWIILTVASFWA